MSVFSHHTLPNAFSNIAKEKYIKLTTFRKNGQNVDTLVWFAVHNGTIYIVTGKESGKARRIRHTPRVLLAPCTASGKVKAAAVEGKARIVTDTQETFVAKAALQRKYGLQLTLFVSLAVFFRFFKGNARNNSGYLAIEPVYIA